jgi:hypothetical protein
MMPSASYSSSLPYLREKNGISPSLNISGKTRLTSIGDYLEIERNYFLVSLAGLANLTSVGTDFRLGTGFGGNHDLISLAGLSNLQTVGGNLWILDNISLKSLTGLDSLISIGGRLEIKDNDSLASLTGIDNVAAGTITAIQIINNDTLASCDFQSLCNYLASPNGVVEIHDNGPGCNSEVEVSVACGVGIGESSVVGRQSSVSISPNPASTQIIIETTTSAPKFQLSIFNFNCQILIQGQITDPRTVIDIGTLPSGVYFVRIVTDRMVMVGKFMKK